MSTKNKTKPISTKTIQEITAPKGATHIDGRWMPSIPANCLLDKGRTGCGATTLAIMQKGSTIIAVPYISLIKSKESQHQDILIGIHGDTDWQAAKDYVKTHTTHKIMVTFNSLPRLVSLLQEQGLDAYSGYHLIIDECQVLLNSYEFRQDDIRSFFNEALKFSSVTYMTATPIKEQYTLDEMKGLPTVRIRWQDEKRIELQSISTPTPAKLTAVMCESKPEDCNLHIFVNSVKMIGRIIRYASLSPSQVRVVCSKNRDSRADNERKLGANIQIADITDPVKQFNFYTSTAFEGCDIYDEKGVAIIVNDGNVPHTLLPVDTLFLQIAGRLRNSIYRDHIVNIFSPTAPDRNISFDEYREASIRAFKEAEEYARRMNANNDREDLETLHTDRRYVRIEDGRVTADRDMLNCDLMKRELQDVIYSSRNSLRREIAENGIVITEAKEYFVTKEYTTSPTKRERFEDVFERYCTLKSSQGIFPNAEQVLIERNKPIVKNAYDTLGAAAVRRLKYKVSDIKRELIKVRSANDTERIMRLVRESVHYGKAVPRAKVTEILQGIYNTLGIRKTAVATDLDRWFETKKQNLRIDGTQTACITILCEKKAVYEIKPKQLELFPI